MDNNACSSPRKVLWVGNKETISSARNKFWNAVNLTIKSKDYNLNIIYKFEKYLDVLDLVETTKKSISLEKISEELWLIQQNTSSNVGKYGRFTELQSKDLINAIDKLDDDEQTLTYAGFNKNDLKIYLSKQDTQVDRVVPIGMALNIDFDWDGIDVLNRLSRFINYY